MNGWMLWRVLDDDDNRIVLWLHVWLIVESFWVWEWWTRYCVMMIVWLRIVYDNWLMRCSLVVQFQRPCLMPIKSKYNAPVNTKRTRQILCLRYERRAFNKRAGCMNIIYIVDNSIFHLSRSHNIILIMHLNSLRSHRSNQATSHHHRIDQIETLNSWTIPGKTL